MKDNPNRCSRCANAATLPLSTHIGAQMPITPLLAGNPRILYLDGEGREAPERLGRELGQKRHATLPELRNTVKFIHPTRPDKSAISASWPSCMGL